MMAAWLDLVELGGRICKSRGCRRVHRNDVMSIARACLDAIGPNLTIVMPVAAAWSCREVEGAQRAARANAATACPCSLRWREQPGKVQPRMARLSALQCCVLLLGVRTHWLVCVCAAEGVTAVALLPVSSSRRVAVAAATVSADAACAASAARRMATPGVDHGCALSSLGNKLLQRRARAQRDASVCGVRCQCRQELL